MSYLFIKWMECYRTRTWRSFTTSWPPIRWV